MIFSNQQLLLLSSVFAPLSVLLVVVMVWRWRRGFHKERAPVSEKLLRPPGESLRIQLEKFEEQINEMLMLAFFGPCFFTALMMVSEPAGARSRSGVILAIIFLVAVAAWFVFPVRKLLELVEKKRKCRIGFAGERAVAEELNLLMLDGCRIFHDVPMEPYGNIDHVIVAPSGIYAVETKTRRKRKAPAGQKEHEMVFDGKALHFPGHVETLPLEQARQQADRLRAFLSKAVGEAAAVYPVLTFPGWFVITRVKADIKVLNPKLIARVVLDERWPKLSSQLLKRIVHQLDQKCRNVEF